LAVEYFCWHLFEQRGVERGHDAAQFVHQIIEPEGACRFAGR
jgi:hypothetical protein